MKRILLLIVPVILILLAFRPITLITVTGSITDDKGSPVAGASVFVKGTKSGTSSKTDGTYRIVVTKANDVLVFSAVGMETQEVKVKGRSIINVSLTMATNTMSEVVVVGYGRAQKKEMTGSVATVHPSQLYGSRGYDQPLQGKVSGIYIQGEQGYYTNDKPVENFEREGYDNITENKFLKVADNPLSTFSIDVDAASYSNIRRFLNNGQLPPAGAVRIEEMVNYFTYEYPQPENNEPFSINTEIADAPWNKNHKLVLIGLQGKKISTENLPASNLVFLIDVSGSMTSIGEGFHENAGGPIEGRG